MSTFLSPRPEEIFVPEDDILVKYHTTASMKNFFYYCRYALGIDFTWFHKEWFNYYTEKKSTYIISSRRHAKSTFSQALASWELIRSVLTKKPISILVVMNSFDQTKEWMRYFQAMLVSTMDRLDFNVGMVAYEETSDTDGNKQTDLSYKDINQNIRQNAIGRIELSTGSKIYGRSLTGKIRGLNADLIICDDLLDKKMNLSFEEAEHIFRAVILGVREEHTKCLYVGTIIKQGDILDKLFTGEIKGFYGKKYPAVLNEKTKEVLWKELRSYEYLMEQRALVGELDFQVEYMLNPLSDKLSLVPRSMADNCKNKDILLNRPTHPDATYVIGVDLQISASVNSDWSVFTTLEILNGKWRIFEMTRLKGEKDYQLQVLRDQARRCNAEDVRIEANQAQRWFADDFKKQNYLQQVTTHHTGTEKYDTQIGIPSLRSLFANKMIEIPWGEGETYSDPQIENTRDIMSLFIDELAGWQYDTEKNKFISRSKHDDTTMSLWLAILSARDLENSGWDVIGYA